MRYHRTPPKCNLLNTVWNLIFENPEFMLAVYVYTTSNAYVLRVILWKRLIEPDIKLIIL